MNGSYHLSRDSVSVICLNSDPVLYKSENHEKMRHRHSFVVEMKPCKCGRIQLQMLKWPCMCVHTYVLNLKRVHNLWALVQGRKRVQRG